MKLISQENLLITLQIVTITEEQKALAMDAIHIPLKSKAKFSLNLMVLDCNQYH